MPRHTRILLVEEQRVVREGVQRLLESQEDFAVVGLADRPGAALRLLGEARPDVILLGTRSIGDPVAVIKQLLAAAPEARVLVAGDATVPISRLLVAGAGGFVRAAASPAELYDAIRTVAAGQAWVDGEAVGDLVDHLKRSRSEPGLRDIDGLTQRQRQIVVGVSRGESNREIADRLGISEATVKDYLTAIFGRLGLANRAELSAWATRHGLGDEPD